MHEISILAASAHFVAGLSLVALAAMIWLSFGHGVGRPGAWGLAAVVALAAAEWCGLFLGSSAAGQIVCLALLAGALVGLVELGSSFIAHRGGLLPRWSYAAIGGVVLGLGYFLGPWWSELSLRLAIAWQMAWLTAAIFRVSDAAGGGGHAAEKTISLGLTAFAIAACAPVPIVEALATLVVAGAAYLALAPAADATRRSRLTWRCAWPTAFLVIAIGGCSLLMVRTAAEPTMLAMTTVEAVGGGGAGPAPGRQTSDEGDPTIDESEWQGAFSSAPQDASSSPMMGHAKRLGMGIGPIAAFVLVVWGLSRLPFVH